MNFGSFTIPPPMLAVIVVLLIVAFFLLSYRRRVSHDGKWKLGSNIRDAWTDQCTGTSFATKHRVLLSNELGKRRQRFGKPAWSWPITLVVAGLATIAYFGLKSL